MMATKLAQRSKGQAVTKLRQVFARVRRGARGMRTRVWMFRFKQSQKAKLAEAAEALARKVAQRCKGKAVRKLGLIWSRMMRGETGMCIHVWRTKVKDGDGASKVPPSFSCCSSSEPKTEDDKHQSLC